jgi:hypothetical protein
MAKEAAQRAIKFDFNHVVLLVTNQCAERVIVKKCILFVLFPLTLLE